MERKIELWLVFNVVTKRVRIRIDVTTTTTHHHRRLLIIRYDPGWSGPSGCCDGSLRRLVRVEVRTNESGFVVEDWRRRRMMMIDAEVAASSGAFAFVSVLVTAESLRGVELAWTVLAREEAVDGGRVVRSGEGVVFLVWWSMMFWWRRRTHEVMVERRRWWLCHFQHRERERERLCVCVREVLWKGLSCLYICLFASFVAENNICFLNYRYALGFLSLSLTNFTDPK